MFEYWTTPPIDPIIKVYVFNYSNIADVESGVDKRIRVEEIGPYVYRERIIKTGLKYEGDKVTFNVSSTKQECLLIKRRYKLVSTLKAL